MAQNAPSDGNTNRLELHRWSTRTSVSDGAEVAAHGSGGLRHAGVVDELNPQRRSGTAITGAISYRIYVGLTRLHAGVGHNAVGSHKAGLLCQMRIRRHADPDNQNVRINLTTAFQCSPYKLSILASDFRERFPGDDIDAGITMARLEKCGDRRTGDPGKYARRSLDYRNFLTGLRQSGRDFKPYSRTNNAERAAAAAARS